MATHYTAHLNVTVTETPAETKAGYHPETKDRYANTNTPASRVVTDAATVVVRAETIEALQVKLAAHVALLNGN